jgi:hypothetical protein
MRLEMIARRATLCAAVAAGTLLCTRANAEFVLDLAASSPQNAGNGGLFYSTDLQPTGTGVLQPFVRIQAKPTEEGYNTDGTIEFDTKDNPGNWTHSITLSQVPIVNIGGVNYREFVLDINETKSAAGRFLSMNEFQVFVSTSPSLTGFDRTAMTFASPGATQVYDLDTGPHGDKLVRMDYSQASGSGSGDMFAYVQDSLFTGKTGPYVYLYSKFGFPDTSDAGFEEWAVRPASNPAVPLPASLWGGLALLGALGAGKIRSRRRSA